MTTICNFRMKFTSLLFLGEAGAIKACENFGSDWKVSKITDRTVICTKGSTRWVATCNSCETWRMLVWEDGGFEHNKGYSVYKGEYINDRLTVAGKYYGGHDPCARPWDRYTLCGDWTSA